MTDNDWWLLIVTDYDWKSALSCVAYQIFVTPLNYFLSFSIQRSLRATYSTLPPQRIHDYDLLIERANWWKIPLDSISGRPSPLSLSSSSYLHSHSHSHSLILILTPFYTHTFTHSHSHTHTHTHTKFHSFHRRLHRLLQTWRGPPRWGWHRTRESCDVVRAFFQTFPNSDSVSTAP